MAQNHSSTAPISYLALGDSYTICEGATWEQSWPYLLTQHLKEEHLDIKLIGNPSVTGYTTQQLIDIELPVFDKQQPNFVTLLIGVNDYVQGRSTKEFSKNLVYILDYLQKRMPDKSKILIITIPDYSVTPNGAQYAKGRNVTEGITEFNEIINKEAQKRQLPCVDIFPSTLKMKEDASLISRDGLHPSAKEYSNWERMIRPVASALLKR